jgi:hypothetical protein
VITFILLIKLFVSTGGGAMAACKDSLVESNDARSFTRSWRTYDGTGFCLDYRIKHEDYQLSRFQRNSLDPFETKYKEGYWTTVYDEVHRGDHDLLDAVCDSIRALGLEAQMGRFAFAEVLMCFVQDIDYAYILTNNDCLTSKYQDHPCVGNEKFGILSPIEFLYTLNGDCDTRCVLLYCLLEYFDYEVVIATSNEYAHAMIGVNLPGAGDFIMHNGTKYYMWETTASGWQLGMMPQDSNNMNYWEIDLD